MDDMDKVMGKGNGAAGAFDYNDAFAGATEAVPERKVSGAVVPGFGYYLVHFGGARVGFKKTGIPSVRPWCQIKEGPEGTQGVLVSDDIGNPFIAPSPTEEVDGVRQHKTSEKLSKQAGEIQGILNRVAKVGRFVQTRPNDLNSAESLEAYAGQFGANGGFDAVVEIGYEASKDGYPERNRIKWGSIAGLDDPAQTKQFAGKTAAEEARAKIAAKNAGTKTNAPRAVAKAAEALFN